MSCLKAVLLLPSWCNVTEADISGHLSPAVFFLPTGNVTSLGKVHVATLHGLMEAPLSSRWPLLREECCPLVAHRIVTRVFILFTLWSNFTHGFIFPFMVNLRSNGHQSGSCCCSLQHWHFLIPFISFSPQTFCSVLPRHFRVNVYSRLGS